MKSSPSNVNGLLCLAGGSGSRLGIPKAHLDWKGEPLLLRVLGRLEPLSTEVVVSARAGQHLPEGQYLRVDDTRGEGALAGLAAGLDAFAASASNARIAVVACDYPFASVRLMRHLATRTDADLVLPSWRGQTHPLHAIWRARLSSLCYDLLEAGERRVHAAVEACHAQIVDDFAGLTIDPDRTLQNVNDPESLRRARGES